MIISRNQISESIVSRDSNCYSQILGVFVSASLFFLVLFVLVGYVEEMLWWPIQSPNIGIKKKASS